MNQEYYTLLTPAGLAAVTNAMMSQTPVDFAFIAVGDSNGTPYNPTGNETSLVNETWRAPVSNYNLDEDNSNWLNLESVIPSVTGGFTIREIGLYDTNGVLLAIGKTSELYKPVSTQGAIIDLRVVMTIEVTNADQVIINIDPSVIYASKQYVDAKHQLVVEPLNAHIPDSTAHVRYGVASGANDKTFSISPAPHAYVDGMAVAFKNTTANTAAVTLNVNGLGAKSLVKSNGAAIGAGQLKANGIYTARYNATTGNFTLQGEGGEYGDAVAKDVRLGKTLGTENGLLTGALDLSKLIANNIRKDIVIDGVTGTLVEGSRRKNGYIGETTINSINETTLISITDLGFTPSVVIFNVTDSNDYSTGLVTIPYLPEIDLNNLIVNSTSTVSIIAKNFRSGGFDIVANAVATPPITLRSIKWLAIE